MRIEVTGDSSRREITFQIRQGTAPDLDVTESWHRKPRVIRPYKGTLVVIDGEQRRITVHGWLVLKGGRASTEIGSRREWRRTASSLLERERIENAPEWVQLVWKEAPLGIVAWSVPDPE